MNCKTISINNSVEYNYHIDKQLLANYDLALILSKSSFRKAIFLIDENVWEFHKTYITTYLIDRFDQQIVKLIPSGESAKSMALFQDLIEQILAENIDRATPLFAIGGGVTGDLSGYIASSLLRGLPFIQVPTTTLAMVDSSIGGKTGINSLSGKNLIGAFYQPKAVLADLNFLSSLPKREMLCGISETIKHGAIAKPSLIKDASHWLSREDEDTLAELLLASAMVKMEIITEDVLEKGIRAYLNLGHTFGHAIEVSSGYGQFLHGEAVFLGILAADFAASKLLGSDLHQIWDDFIPYYRAVITAKRPKIASLLPYMYKDKKTLNGQINLVLTRKHGSAELVSCNELQLIQDSFAYAFDKMQLNA